MNKYWPSWNLSVRSWFAANSKYCSLLAENHVVFRIFLIVAYVPAGQCSQGGYCIVLSTSKSIILVIIEQGGGGR